MSDIAHYRIAAVLLAGVALAGCQVVPRGTGMGNVGEANWRCEQHGGVAQLASSKYDVNAATCKDGTAVGIHGFLYVQKDGTVTDDNGKPVSR